MMIQFNGREYNCPLEMTIDLIGGKWKVLILWNLSENVLRFNEIKRQFPSITQKMLTQQLRDMERDGLIARKIYTQIPPKVEYSLTEFGRSLLPVLQAMNVWGGGYISGLPTGRT